jgi:O-antigen ligase/polysaccharide polymerase Wzy-like membrane protein
MTTLAYAGLWIFVFAIPWGALVAESGIAIVPRATGALALGLTLFTVVITGRFRRWHLLHVMGLLFVIWAGAGLLVIGVTEVPPKYWTYVQLFLVLWMVWELAPSGGRQLGLLTAYVLGAHAAALSTIVLSRTAAGMMRRFAAGGTDPNDLAATLALALPMAWYLGMTYRRPLWRWVCRAYIPIGVVAIGLTGSRGGLLAAMVALLIVPLTMTNLSPGRRAIAIVLLCLSGVVAALYVPQTLMQRLASTGSEVEGGTLHGRIEIWKAGANAFSRKPLMGYGTGFFKEAVTPWVGRRVAHNSYLSVLVEQGLVGFLLYAMMLVAAFFAVLNLPRMERRFALVLMATLAITLLPLTWEDRRQVWFILAALVGLSQAPDLRSRETLRQAPLRPPLSPARPIAVPGTPVRPPSRSSTPPIRAPRHDA